MRLAIIASMIFAAGLWSGLTKTIVGEDTDRVEEFKRVAAIDLAGMQKDGYIR